MKTDDTLLAAFVRFIPGAIFGAGIGFWFAAELQEPVLFFGAWAGVTLLFGVLSVVYGIEFWEAIRDSWRWWS